MRARRAVTAAAVAALASAGAAGGPRAARAQLSTVRGVVRGDDGAPVAGALVRLEALARGAVTDDSGRFVLRGVPGGRYPGVVRRLGFLPGDFVLELPGGVAVDLLVRMVESPTPLPSIVVNGERRDYALHANGYYERARGGVGTFLGPERLAEQGHVSLSTLLREIPRLNFRCDVTGRRCSAGPEGCPRVWVDGQAAPEGVFDEVIPRHRLRAVEVYYSAHHVPAPFVRPGDRCGAVALWTDVAPTWSRYLPRRVVSVRPPPPPTPLP